MCKLDKYIENNNGYIAKCCHSDTIQILYGNILLAVNKNNFLKIINIVDNSKKQHQHITDLNQRIVVMNTQANGLYITMNIEELNEFSDMLNETKFLIDVEDISFG